MIHVYNEKGGLSQRLVYFFPKYFDEATPKIILCFFCTMNNRGTCCVNLLRPGWRGLNKPSFFHYRQFPIVLLGFTGILWDFLMAMPKISHSSRPGGGIVVLAEVRDSIFPDPGYLRTFLKFK